MTEDSTGDPFFEFFGERWFFRKMDGERNALLPFGGEPSPHIQFTDWLKKNYPEAFI